MKPHDTFLELAAVAVDFPLSASERGRLDVHLAGCAACRRMATALRGDAMALTMLPPVVLPQRRAAELLDGVVHPGAVRHPARLLLVLGLLGLVLLGSLAVGAELLRRTVDDDLSVVPVPSLTPEPSASPRPERLVGTTWIDTGIPEAADRPVVTIEAVTAGGPGFVAVGRGCLDTGGDLPECEGVVLLSTDGRTWSRAPRGDATNTGAFFPTSGPEIGMFDVAAGEAGIVAIGYAARPDMAATTWFSGDDGDSWQRVVIGPVATTRVNAVAWDGTRFVAVGVDRSEWDGTLEGMASARAWAAAWTSSDGLAWTRAERSGLDVGDFKDTTEDPSTGGMADVTATGDGFVAVGSVCASTPPTAPPACRPAAWTSVDGSSWVRALGVPEMNGGLAAVAATGARLLAIGGGGVLSSTDGRTWTSVGFYTNLRDLAVVGGRFFVTTEASTTYASADGQDWTLVRVGGSPADVTPIDPAEWHYASNGPVAVAIGTDPESHDPRAMVSEGR